MPDTPSTRTHGSILNQRIKDYEIKELGLHKNTGQLNLIKAHIDQLKRQVVSGNINQENKLKGLEEQRDSLTKTVDKAKVNLANMRVDITQEMDVEGEPDPVAELNVLDSKYPILMMPLRIETRFKKIPSKTNENIKKDQLWVRVFPDDCSVDTFEPLLSETEVENAQDFWAEWVSAQGLEDGRRAAWRSLVENHGAGRSQYIIDKYYPHDYQELQKPYQLGVDQSLYLVIKVKENEIGGSDREELAKYWLAIWNAKRDAEAINEAYENFNTEGGQEFKDYLIEKFVPINLEDDFSGIEGIEGIEYEVIVKYMDFPENYEEKNGIQQNSWSKAPRVRIMPERLYLVGYREGKKKIEMPGANIPFPLICGPDPQATKEELESYLDEDFRISPDMKWMVDFYQATASGMAFIVENKDDEDNNILLGYDRLMIVGVRTSADTDSGRQMIEELFSGHYYGNTGFSFLPVGTNTNNVREEAESGYTEQEDSDDSFDQLFLNSQTFKEDNSEITPDHAKSDRHWFNTLLGFNPAFFAKTVSTSGYDQRDARAMNIALWPATWGYFFDTMMKPLFSDWQIEILRNFFTMNVIGRGSIPSVRIGDQPYGILPTTVFSRLQWFEKGPIYTPVPKVLNANFPDSKELAFLQKIYNIILDIHSRWKEMSQDVKHVGSPGGDPHQKLLDILGHHGGSVEFHNRLTMGLNHMWNYYLMSYQPSFNWFNLLNNVTNPFDDFIDSLNNLNDKHDGIQLLKDLGYHGETKPEILEKFFSYYSAEISNLIEDSPLSEINPLKYSAQVTIEGTSEKEDKNYIEWLIHAAKESLSTLKNQGDFINNERPRSLLYIMLHHALELGYFSSGMQLYSSKTNYSLEDLMAYRTEFDFHGILDPQITHNIQSGNLSRKPLESPFSSSSRYYLLDTQQREITEGQNISVADYITQKINDPDFDSLYVKNQVEALKYLQNLSTAELERAFVEHLDCATYRLDAWQLGFIHWMLPILRSETRTEDGSAGLYIGAFGWLENVKSENKIFEKIESFEDDDLQEFFAPTSDEPILKDDKNYGYIQAPSLNHAVTASILRNANKSRASEEDAEVYAINLSSERVRKALGIIEGIQQGQNLAALLGYQFERYLHDSVKEVDNVIFDLRRQFPLAANQMLSTKIEEEDNAPDEDLEVEEVPIDAIGASNVVDGLDLIKFVEEYQEKEGQPDYINDLNLTDATDEEKEIVKTAIDYIRDINDATADLATAESIHQLAQGNIDRAAGNLDTYSKGAYPQVPEVVQTPRSGVQVTHRVGIHIPMENANANSNPRVLAEPGIDKFLEDLLPPLNTIKCEVIINNKDIGIENRILKIYMSDLGLEPIDLHYMLNDTEQAMTMLDDIIVDFAQSTIVVGQDNDGEDLKLREDSQFEIKYYVTNNDAEKFDVSLFELLPLIKNLRSVLLRSRPLKPSDITMPEESDIDLDGNIQLNSERLGNVVKYFQDIYRIDCTTEEEDHSCSLLKLKYQLDSMANKEEMSLEELQAIDATSRVLQEILKRLSLLGIPNTGTGFIRAWKQEQIKALIDKFKEIKKRWITKNDEFKALMDVYPNDGTIDEKKKILFKAQRLIRTSSENIENPDGFKDTLETWKVDNFDVKLSSITGFISANHQGISGLYNFIIDEENKLLELEAFDLTPVNINNFLHACSIFTQDMLGRCKLIEKDLRKRLTAYHSYQNELTNEASALGKAELTKNMAKQLLSEDFVMVPKFKLTEDKTNEWLNAYEHIDQLLRYQKETKKESNPLPVDDWFYGVARVREKMWHLEQMICLAEGYRNISLELTPIQLPYLEPYCWFALDFGINEGEKEEDLMKNFIENDHLLYTALYEKDGFDNESDYQCGLLIDEWTEIIPAEEETTGTAFHYDRPNSEAPQTMLLVTSPQFAENWKWEDLKDALYETLEEAKIRGVEPEQLDKTGFACFLPATMASLTRHPVTISANYSQSVLNYNINNISDNE